MILKNLLKSFIETSKGKTVLSVVNDLFNKYDLLCTIEREEAIIQLEKVSKEITKIDTYRLINFYF